MQNEKYTFIFILNIENMESALPVKRKIKKLWPYQVSDYDLCPSYDRQVEGHQLLWVVSPL